MTKFYVEFMSELITLIFSSVLHSIIKKMIKIEEDEVAYLKELLKGYQYSPVAKISYGSYGQIFQIKDNKQIGYVLKVVSKKRMIKEHKLHEAVIESFLLKKMSHPGVVKFFETIETNEYIGLVLQLCPYGDLADIMKKVNKNIELSLKKREIALFLLAQILEVLDYLHQKQIMHRDLKMQNIVMGKDCNIRLIDFGTSKPLSPEKVYSQSEIQFIQKLRNSDEDSFTEEQLVLRNKSFVGSAAYLSPQSINMNYSLSTDVWAFGILAYKIFHGRIPFEGENTYQIFKKIKEFDLKLNDKLDPQIQQLIKACLQVDAANRPTVKQLKNYAYFKQITFSQIFKAKSPIHLVFLTPQPRKNSKSNSVSSASVLLFEMLMEKKMFFGNYKSRRLKIEKKYGKLYISYWYPEGACAKNQFQVYLGDCAFFLGDDTFQIRNKDVKYKFRLLKSQNAQKIVQKINKIISDYFHEE